MAVSELEEKLNAILSNPEAMGQVMNLAQALNLGGGNTEGAPEKPAQTASQGENQSDLSGILGQLDPNLIQRVLPLIRELASNQNDERMQLLYALRPFLRPERREKVEQAARTAKLIHIGKKLLGGMGEQHV